jgi:hypothetical protein
MLAGVFGVPLALLWLGHRLRRRSERARAAFWGAVVGHVLVAPVAVVAAMTPPAEWAANDTLRGALGFWAMLVVPILGACIAAMRARRAPVRPAGRA